MDDIFVAWDHPEAQKRVKDIRERASSSRGGERLRWVNDPMRMGWYLCAYNADGGLEPLSAIQYRWIISPDRMGY